MSDLKITKIEDMGWDEFFAANFRLAGITGQFPVRVTAESRGLWLVRSEDREYRATVSGRLRHDGGIFGIGQPAVGDWAVFKPDTDGDSGVIHAVLPRKSKFTRKMAGEKTAEQIVAANIDTVFIVSGLDGGRNLNIRRIERYLTLAWSSGASPVLLLNKIDICPDYAIRLRDVEAIAGGVPVHAVSARDGSGIDELRGYLGSGRTVAFIGSSGAGKSALTNALTGEEKQKTGEVCADDLEGRHTTTRREIFYVPGGGMVIDTPGMRELQLWAGEDDLNNTFSEIAELGRGCRFNDCTHTGEPGCAVLRAVDKGQLDNGRLNGYHKLNKELEHLAMKEDQLGRLQQKKEGKRFSKMARNLQRNNLKK